LAVNFWFNYENIFDKKEFPSECETNKLDLNKTLEKFDYKPQIDDFLTDFK